MSKRPRIKQADGSLLDLPLDAETIKGKKLEEIALKTDIPTKTSELTNDSGFLTKHQDISGKADKTELKNYLPLSGAKKMTGDLDMDYYDITNTRLYDKETHNYIALSGLDNGALPFSSKSGALELRSPEMDDLDTANFLIYPTPENTNHIAGQEYETYEWNLPKESGTIALDKDIPTDYLPLSGGIMTGDICVGDSNTGIACIGLMNKKDGPYKKGWGFNDSGDPCILNQSDRSIYFSTTELSDDYMCYTFPEKSGTIALLSDLEGLGGGSSSGSSTSSGTVDSFLWEFPLGGEYQELDVGGYQSVEVELICDSSLYYGDVIIPNNDYEVEFIIGHNEECVESITMESGTTALKIIIECENGFFRIMRNGVAYSQSGLWEDGCISYFGCSVISGGEGDGTSKTIKFLVKGVVA